MPYCISDYFLFWQSKKEEKTLIAAGGQKQDLFCENHKIENSTENEAHDYFGCSQHSTDFNVGQNGALYSLEQKQSNVQSR